MKIITKESTHVDRKRTTLMAYGLWLTAVPIHAQFTHADSLRGYLFQERSCYDVRYYEIGVELDTGTHELNGNVTMYFNALRPSKRIQIDLHESWHVGHVAGNNIDRWDREGNAIYVTYTDSLKAGPLLALTVYYSGRTPEAENAPWDGGFVWARDGSGKPWIGVACEGEGASLWWPCKDHPSDEPDSVRISVTVPAGLTAVCNGRLDGINDYEEMMKFTWIVRNPINTYNVTLNVADYAHFSDTMTGLNGPLTLDYYVLKANLDKAKRQFRQVEPMMHCFEQHFGPYPFYRDGYKLVETAYLGMEHQSAIAYGNHYLPGYLGMDMSGKGFDYIIIHESGHEWFGNSITADDMAELWIHEGFTTYSEAIYLECLYDYQTAIAYLNNQRWGIDNESPIVGPRDVAYDHLHQTDMYYKGSWTLQTLRKVVNSDTLWFAMLRDFCREFYHRITNTGDVIRFFSERSGMNLEPVFRQYLYSPNVPVLEYKVGKGGVARYRWANVAVDFTMPIEIRYSADEAWIRIRPTTEWQEIKITGKKPEGFIVNTEEWYVEVLQL